MQDNRHSVVLEQRKNLTVNGVDSVCSFSEAKIVLRLTMGDKMTIVGSKLKITGFVKANGTFTAEGDVMGISYGGKSLAARIFK